MSATGTWKRAYLLFVTLRWAVFLVALAFVLPALASPIISRIVIGAWVFVYLASWYEYLRTADIAGLKDDGTIEFRSVLARTVIRSEDITQIRGAPMKRFTVEVRHGTGRLSVFKQQPTLPELVRRVRIANPDATIEGV